MKLTAIPLAAMLAATLTPATAGEPPEPFDVKAYLAVKVPDDENAAVPIAKAFALMDPYDNTAGELLEQLEDEDRWLAVQPKHRKAIRDVLKSHAAALKLFRVGLARPRGFFDLGPKAAFNTTMEHVSQARAMTRLLQVEAAGHILDGDGAAALESYLDIIRMGRVVERRGPYLSALLGMALDAIGTKGVQGLLRSKLATPAICRRAAQVLTAQLTAVAPPSKAVKMEYIMMINSMSADEDAMERVFGQDLKKSVGPSPINRLGADVALRSMFLQARRSSRVFYAELLKVCDRPYRDVIREPLISDPTSVDVVKEDILLRPMLQAVEQVFHAYGRRQGRYALTRALAAVRAYELEKGRMPRTLKALVPVYLKAVPVDPYDGKPVRLARVDDRWVLYSIGSDKEDNGGKTDWKWGYKPGDWIVPVHRE